jgi:hypothetical protein
VQIVMMQTSAIAAARLRERRGPGDHQIARARVRSWDGSFEIGTTVPLSSNLSRRSEPFAGSSRHKLKRFGEKETTFEASKGGAPTRGNASAPPDHNPQG